MLIVRNGVLFYLNRYAQHNAMDHLFGRQEEIAELTRYYESGKAEFVALYGRRRVGKTYLVDRL